MAAMKLAIIGGGPSAFYVASRILSLNSSPGLRIHMYDRLWAPHGLVRYGVAPDHPEVKNCTHKFDAAATDPRFRFFGNVNIGGPDSSNPIPHALPLPLSSICSRYTHLLFATGCTQPTHHEALPPSSRIIPALSFVHWYTQHPSNPTPPPLKYTSHVSIIGNGNVALDIARILLSTPKALQEYDVPRNVMSVLEKSTVQHVNIIARRGPLEVAFTAKELRELLNLPQAAMLPVFPDFLKPPSDKPLTRQQSRIFGLLEQGSKMQPGSVPRTWSLGFYRSPTGYVPPSTRTPSALGKLSLDYTKVDPITKRAVPTGGSTVIGASLVIPSLGFHGEPDMPFFDPKLGHLRSVSGRIVDESGNAVPNVYASGWAAMGARGVLASTMIDAYTVAETILRDLDESKNGTRAKILEREDSSLSMSREVQLDELPPEVEQGLRDKMIVQYSDWKKIDEEEVRRGYGPAFQKERERMQWEDARTFIS